MDRWDCGYVFGMAVGGGVGVQWDWGERGTWLEMGQQLGEEWDPVVFGCSIHPSARLSRCVPGELGSWGQGLRLGHRHGWCRDCIHEGERAVGVMAMGSPE